MVSISELPQRLDMAYELGQDMVVMVPGGVHIALAMFSLEWIKVYLSEQILEESCQFQENSNQEGQF